MLSGLWTQGLLLLLQDLNHDPSNPNTRLYATHAAQPYHNDASDIVGNPPKLPSRLCLNGGCEPFWHVLQQRNSASRIGPFTTLSAGHLCTC